MAARAEQILHLLRQNGPVRDLHRPAVVDLANGGVPGDDVLLLLGIREIICGHDVLPFQSFADPSTQLRGNVVKVGVPEGHRHSFLQVVQRFPHGQAGIHLGLGLILHHGAVTVHVPVVHPEDVAPVGGDRHTAEAGHSLQPRPQRIHFGGVGLFPLVVGVPIHTAYAPYQGRRICAGDPVGHGRVGCPRPGVEVAVTGGVDDHLGQDGLAPLFALIHHTSDHSVLHNGSADPAVAHDGDGVTVLLEHFVQLDFQLVGLKVNRTHEAVGLRSAVAAPADAVHHGLPGVKQGRVGGTDLAERRCADSIGNRSEAGKPLLLESPDKAFVIPGQVGNHDDIAAGDVPAHVTVPFQQDDVLGARPGGGDGCRVAGGAAAHHKDIALGLHRQRSGGL